MTPAPTTPTECGAGDFVQEVPGLRLVRSVSQRSAVAVKLVESVLHSAIA
ncbi:hypothetical protein [Kibdelosporangium aridum]|nr:hypothetical protein [Kibdelosporangium aridum]